MRIAHLCLANFYVDGFGYQENILPRMHRRMGHEVTIIASTETYLDQATRGNTAPSSYLNEDGIPVHRIPYAKWVPRFVQPKVRAYSGLMAKLREFKPDVIFLHDVQFLDILVVRRYAKENRVLVRADSHTDYVNSARGILSRKLLHGFFYRALVKRSDAVIDRYFPTLPARGDFMHDVYGTSREKMELLPFGFDDALVEGLDRTKVRREMRAGLGVPQDHLVLVTGGKIDLRKNIHVLVDSFSRLRREGRMNGVHLLVFGTPTHEVQRILDEITLDENVRMLGWTPSSEIYRVLWASDLAFFPGTHSVLWEETIGHGLGTVLRRWDGMNHLDLGGNAIFIEDASPANIDRILCDLVASDGAIVRRLGEVAAREGPRMFAFSEIAKRAIVQ